MAGPDKAGHDQAATKPQKPTLTKGMTAEEIVKLIGKPVEVKPMKLPEGSTGKAEVWIYRREAGTRSVPVPSGTREVPGFVNPALTDAAQHTTEIVYTNKIITIEQVTSLLMFDDKLIVARQYQEQRDRY